eukprot:1540775-Rhodomonas_salina.1
MSCVCVVPQCVGFVPDSHCLVLICVSGLIQMAFALGSLCFLTPHPFENVGSLSMLDRVLERYPLP